MTLRLPEFVPRLIIDSWRWVALGVVGVVVAIGYFSLLASKIESVRTEGLLRRSAAHEQLAADTRYRDALRASETAYREKISADARKTIEAFIPTDSDFPSILLTIQDMAQRAGLALTDIKVSEIGQVTAAGDQAQVEVGQSGTAIARAATAQGINLRTQDVSVTVTGIHSYEEVKGFVKIIESSRRLFDIMTLNFSLGSNSGADIGTASAGSPVTFSLRTYYLPATK